jgi:preprotein translocase subunit SecF
MEEAKEEKKSEEPKKQEEKKEHEASSHEHHKSEHQSKTDWYNKHYKTLLIIPLVLLILSLTYIFIFYSRTGDFIIKDVSLSGGTTITLTGNLLEKDLQGLEDSLKAKYDDISFRKLTEFSSQRLIAFVIEGHEDPDTLKLAIEENLGEKLTTENSSTEFSGSALGQNFYKQLVLALVVSFILMSIVIFFLFRSFIPSIAVIFAAFADIAMPLAILNFFGVKLSTAGIAAFLMLVGYSVDTDILLTTRALKKQEGTLNQRIYGAFKTGIFMTLTALAAVLPAFFLITGLPDSFRQIFLILAIGLGADIVNTWLTNAGIIKWYCDKKGIK